MLRCGFIVAVTVALVGCQSPTAPTTRRGNPEDGGTLTLFCFGVGGREMRCSAQLGESNITTRLQWFISDSAVVKQGTAPNEFIAVALGDAFVTGQDPRSGQKYVQPVTVDPGMQLLPTFPITGRVREGSQIIRTAEIRISGGVVSGRTATAGTTPVSPPGYDEWHVSDGYAFLGIPTGVYELTASAEGYIPQSRSITLLRFFGNELNFDLKRAAQ